MVDYKLTNSEMADLLGISNHRISALVKKGILIRSSANQYPLKPSITNYCNLLRGKKVGSGSTDDTEDGVDYYSERARLTKAQADEKEILAAKAAGRLVKISEVERTWVDYITTCKTKLLTIPSKVAHALTTMEDIESINALLKEEIEHSLSELSECLSYGADES